MKFDAITALIRSKYQKLSIFEQKIVLIFLIVLGVLICKNLIECLMYLRPVRQHHNLVRHQNIITIPPYSPLRKLIKVQQIQTHLQNQIYQIPGYAETNVKRNIQISTPVTGKIIAIPVHLGSLVHKGQTLMTLRSPDLADLHSNYQSAIAQLKLTEQLFERAIKVNLAGANSKKDIEIARNNYIAALQSLKSLKKRIKIFGPHNPYSKINIQAPRNGYVTKINYGIGSYITDITAPLMQLNNTEKIWITANIPEHLISAVHPQQMVSFTLSSQTQKIYQGKIAFIAPKMEAGSRTNKTRINIINDDHRIKPNMFAKIELSLPQQSKIIIPTSAILMDYESTSVFKEIKPWTFERVPVEIGYEKDNKVEVLSGLAIGNKIAVAGGIFIND